MGSSYFNLTDQADIFGFDAGSSASEMIYENALSNVGSNDYNVWTAEGGLSWFGDPKCNLFVSDVANQISDSVLIVPFN